MKSYKSIALSFCLSVVSLLIAWLGFEVFCRLVVDNGMHYHLEMWKYAKVLKEISDDPEIGHRHIPNTQAYLMGVNVKINADGLRDDPTSLASDELRVLMLGDSITLGWGVPHAQTVSAYLERNLESRLGQPVDVINAGVGNYNTAMEVAWFFKHGIVYEPDVIILNVFINDAEPMPIYKPIGFWERLLYSRVILIGAWDTISRTLFGGPSWDTYYRDLYADDSQAMQEMQAAIARLANFSREKDVPLVIVIYPELRELNPYPFPEVVEKLHQIAQAHGIQSVSLLPAVELEKPSSLWVTPPDPHPNAFAAELMSSYLTPRLLDFLSLNPK
ncbi:MAG: SGNH/GDSL hydrolase family protein [Rhodospirillaceae bacterium]